MYKLIYSNVLKPRKSLPSFSTLSNRLVYNPTSSQNVTRNVSTEGPEETPAESEINQEKETPIVESHRRSLFPKKSTGRIMFPTKRYVYTSALKYSKYSTPKKKFFLNKYANELYKKAVEQVGEIKNKQKITKPSKITNWAPAQYTTPSDNNGIQEPKEEIPTMQTTPEPENTEYVQNKFGCAKRFRITQLCSKYKEMELDETESKKSETKLRGYSTRDAWPPKMYAIKQLGKKQHIVEKKPNIINKLLVSMSQYTISKEPSKEKANTEEASTQEKDQGSSNIKNHPITSKQDPSITQNRSKKFLNLLETTPNHTSDLEVMEEEHAENTKHYDIDETCVQDKKTIRKNDPLYEDKLEVYKKHRAIAKQLYKNVMRETLRKHKEQMQVVIKNKTVPCPEPVVEVNKNETNPTMTVDDKIEDTTNSDQINFQKGREKTQDNTQEFLSEGSETPTNIVDMSSVNKKTTEVPKVEVPSPQQKHNSLFNKLLRQYVVQETPKQTPQKPIENIEKETKENQENNCSAYFLVKVNVNRSTGKIDMKDDSQKIKVKVVSESKLPDTSTHDIQLETDDSKKIKIEVNPTTEESIKSTQNTAAETVVEPTEKNNCKKLNLKLTTSTMGTEPGAEDTTPETVLQPKENEDSNEIKIKVTPSTTEKDPCTKDTPAPDISKERDHSKDIKIKVTQSTMGTTPFTQDKTTKETVLQPKEEVDSKEIKINITPPTSKKVLTTEAISSETVPSSKQKGDSKDIKIKVRPSTVGTDPSTPALETVLQSKGKDESKEIKIKVTPSTVVSSRDTSQETVLLPRKEKICSNDIKIKVTQSTMGTDSSTQDTTETVQQPKRKHDSKEIKIKVTPPTLEKVLYTEEPPTPDIELRLKGKDDSKEIKIKVTPPTVEKVVCTQDTAAPETVLQPKGKDDSKEIKIKVTQPSLKKVLYAEDTPSIELQPKGKNDPKEINIKVNPSTVGKVLSSQAKETVHQPNGKYKSQNIKNKVTPSETVLESKEKEDSNELKIKVNPSKWPVSFTEATPAETVIKPKKGYGFQKIKKKASPSLVKIVSYSRTQQETHLQPNEKDGSQKVKVTSPTRWPISFTQDTSQETVVQPKLDFQKRRDTKEQDVSKGRQEKILSKEEMKQSKISNSNQWRLTDYDKNTPVEEAEKARIIDEVRRTITKDPKSPYRIILDHEHEFPTVDDEIANTSKTKISQDPPRTEQVTSKELKTANVEGEDIELNEQEKRAKIARERLSRYEAALVMLLGKFPKKTTCKKDEKVVQKANGNLKSGEEVRPEKNLLTAAETEMCKEEEDDKKIYGKRKQSFVRSVSEYTHVNDTSGEYKKERPLSLGNRLRIPVNKPPPNNKDPKKEKPKKGQKDMVLPPRKGSTTKISNTQDTNFAQTITATKKIDNASVKSKLNIMSAVKGVKSGYSQRTNGQFQLEKEKYPMQFKNENYEDIGRVHPDTLLSNRQADKCEERESNLKQPKEERIDTFHESGSNRQQPFDKIVSKSTSPCTKADMEDELPRVDERKLNACQHSNELNNLEKNTDDKINNKEKDTIRTNKDTFVSKPHQPGFNKEENPVNNTRPISKNKKNREDPIQYFSLQGIKRDIKDIVTTTKNPNTKLKIGKNKKLAETLSANEIVVEISTSEKEGYKKDIIDQFMSKLESKTKVRRVQSDPILSRKKHIKSSKKQNSRKQSVQKCIDQEILPAGKVSPKKTSQKELNDTTTYLDVKLDKDKLCPIEAGIGKNNKLEEQAKEFSSKSHETTTSINKAEEKETTKATDFDNKGDIQNKNMGIEEQVQLSYKKENIQSPKEESTVLNMSSASQIPKASAVEKDPLAEGCNDKNKITWPKIDKKSVSKTEIRPKSTETHTGLSTKKLTIDSNTIVSSKQSKGINIKETNKEVPRDIALSKSIAMVQKSFAKIQLDEHALEYIARDEDSLVDPNHVIANKLQSLCTDSKTWKNNEELESAIVKSEIKPVVLANIENAACDSKNSSQKQDSSKILNSKDAAVLECAKDSKINTSSDNKKNKKELETAIVKSQLKTVMLPKMENAACEIKNKTQKKLSSNDDPALLECAKDSKIHTSSDYKKNKKNKELETATLKSEVKTMMLPKITACEIKTTTQKEDSSKMHESNDDPAFLNVSEIHTSSDSKKNRITKNLETATVKSEVKSMMFSNIDNAACDTKNTSQKEDSSKVLEPNDDQAFQECVKDSKIHTPSEFSANLQKQPYTDMLNTEGSKNDPDLKPDTPSAPFTNLRKQLVKELDSQIESITDGNREPCKGDKTKYNKTLMVMSGKDPKGRTAEISCSEQDNTKGGNVTQNSKENATSDKTVTNKDANIKERRTVLKVVKELEIIKQQQNLKKIEDNIYSRRLKEALEKEYKARMYEPQVEKHEENKQSLPEKNPQINKTSKESRSTEASRLPSSNIIIAKTILPDISNAASEKEIERLKRVENAKRMYCAKLCMPHTSLREAALDEESTSTLNRAIENEKKKITPIAKRNQYSKYKHMKITYMTVNRSQPNDEHFLPTIPVKKITVRTEAKQYTKSDLKMMAMRFELLQKLHEEFQSSLSEANEKPVNTNVGTSNVEKHSNKNLKRVRSKSRIKQTKQFKQSFAKICQYYNKQVQKLQGREKAKGRKFRPELIHMDTNGRPTFSKVSEYFTKLIASGENQHNVAHGIKSYRKKRKLRKRRSVYSITPDKNNIRKLYTFAKQRRAFVDEKANEYDIEEKLPNSFQCPAEDLTECQKNSLYYKYTPYTFYDIQDHLKCHIERNNRKADK